MIWLWFKRIFTPVHDIHWACRQLERGHKVTRDPLGRWGYVLEDGTLYMWDTMMGKDYRSHEEFSTLDLIMQNWRVLP